MQAGSVVESDRNTNHRVETSLVRVPVRFRPLAPRCGAVEPQVLLSRVYREQSSVAPCLCGKV